MQKERHNASLMDMRIDRETNSILFTRRLRATREAVFSAWTDPRQVALWWDPTGEPLSLCEIDLRVGGAFTFVSASHPDAPFAGTYLEISPPSALVFEAMGATGSVVLTQEDSSTLMVVTIACASGEQLDQFLKLGVADGTAETLDNLVEHFRSAGSGAA